jgi:hypothetical protein
MGTPAQLPLEILRHILSLVQCSARHLTGVLAADRRLRAVALGASQIWTQIDLSCHPAWVNLCTSRAGRAFLLVTATVDELKSRTDLFARIGGLNLTVPDPFYFQELEDMLAEDCALSLCDLTIHYRGYRHSYGRSGHIWGSSLTRLAVHGGGVGHLPQYPCLRYLYLYEVEFTISSFYKMLTESTAIETLEVRTRNQGIRWLPVDLKSHAPIVLAHLRVLKMRSSARDIGILLQFLPDPAVCFEVTIQASDLEDANPSLLSNCGDTLDRLVRFWRDNTGQSTLPDGRIRGSFGLAADPRASGRLEFGQERDQDEYYTVPSTYFKARIFIDRAAAILDAVQLLEMNLVGIGMTRKAFEQEGLPVNIFTGLKTLRIIEPSYDEESGGATFEDWLRERMEAGMSPPVLEVVGECDEALEFVAYALVGKGHLQDFHMRNDSENAQTPVVSHPVPSNSVGEVTSRSVGDDQPHNLTGFSLELHSVRTTSTTRRTFSARWGWV